MPEINVFEDASIFEQAFPQEGEEPVFETSLKRVVKIDPETGEETTAVIPIEYRIPTAAEITQITQKREKLRKHHKGSLPPEESLKELAEVLSIAIRNLKITGGPKGSSNLKKNEISIFDLTGSEIQKLRVAISPNSSKSDESVEDSLGEERRMVGKGARTKAKRPSVPALDAP